MCHMPAPRRNRVQTTLYKVKTAMCNCGALSIPELRRKAKLTVVSSYLSLRVAAMTLC